jgi:hypothetical protein
VTPSIAKVSELAGFAKPDPAIVIVVPGAAVNGLTIVIAVVLVVEKPAVPSEPAESETPITWNPVPEDGTMKVPATGAVVPHTPVVPPVIVSGAPLNVPGLTSARAAVSNP